MWCRAIFHAFAPQLYIVIVIIPEGTQTLRDFISFTVFQHDQMLETIIDSPVMVDIKLQGIIMRVTTLAGMFFQTQAVDWVCVRRYTIQWQLDRRSVMKNDL